MEIIKDNAFEAWKEILDYVVKNGDDYVDRDKRLCREVKNLKVTILSSKLIKKAIRVLSSFDEWFYPPIEEIISIMLTKDPEKYYYGYGSRIFNLNTINQIKDFIIPLLKKDPFSRRAVVTLWDPKTDSNINNKEVPGIVCIDFKVRNGKLNLTATIRSNDMFFGWPANVYQLYVIQQHILKTLKRYEEGTLTTFSTSAHIFENQFNHIEKIKTK